MPKEKRLTQRALDGGYAARFLAFFWLWVFPVSMANPPSHPPQVTLTVRRIKKARVSMVYHLNKQSKFLTVGIGSVSCLVGLVVFVSMLISGQIAQNVGTLLFLEFLFGFLGIELVYEGLRTRIEVFEDRLVYYQPRYAFSAQWSDLSAIVPSASSVLLFFSKSTKISGGLIYDVIKTTNLHSSLAISMYLTDENRTLIREKIAAGLKVNSEGDTRWLSELI